MTRAIALLIIGLVFGGGLGFVLAASNGVTLDGHDHATDHGPALTGTMPATPDPAHAHLETLDLPAGAPAPTLAISLAPDPVSGLNLHIQTTNFTFAPEHSGGPHVPGEGHAHLYVDGVKIARLYGPWAHIAELPLGAGELSVILTSNDHKTLAVNGLALAATIGLDQAPGN